MNSFEELEVEDKFRTIITPEGVVEMRPGAVNREKILLLLEAETFTSVHLKHLEDPAIVMVFIPPTQENTKEINPMAFALYQENYSGDFQIRGNIILLLEADFIKGGCNRGEDNTQF